jgi:hypothetical protein
MVRLNPGAEKSPVEESVVMDKHHILLKNGNGRITVTLGKSQKLTQETNMNSVSVHF